MFHNKIEQEIKNSALTPSAPEQSNATLLSTHGHFSSASSSQTTMGVTMASSASSSATTAALVPTAPIQELIDTAANLPPGAFSTGNTGGVLTLSQGQNSRAVSVNNTQDAQGKSAITVSTDLESVASKTIELATANNASLPQISINSVASNLLAQSSSSSHANTSNSNPTAIATNNSRLLYNIAASNVTIVQTSHLKSLELNPSQVEQLIAKIRQNTLKNVDSNEQQYYIPVKGCWHNNYADNFELYTDSAVDKPGEINNFLSGKKKVLLLLGNSGAGKTMFLQNLTILLSQKFKSKPTIVLYIMLGSFEDPTKNLIEQHLKRLGLSEDEIRELKSKINFIIILDGRDEIINDQHQNLYATNKLDEWNAQVIISCRLSYVLRVPDYRRRFYPVVKGSIDQNNFSEISLVPFSPEQRNRYIEKFLQNPPEELVHELVGEWRQPKVYFEFIEKLPDSVKKLITTPFLLRVFVEVMRLLAAKWQNAPTIEQLQLTTASLYDLFIENYFKRQANKLAALGNLPIDGDDIILHFGEFSKELATEMFVNNVTHVVYRKASSLFGSKSKNVWDKFFGNQDPNVKRALDGCPIKKLAAGEQQTQQEDCWAFLHDSLREYFFSREQFEQLLSDDIQAQATHLPMPAEVEFSAQPTTSNNDDDDGPVPVTAPVLVGEHKQDTDQDPEIVAAIEMSLRMNFS